MTEQTYWSNDNATDSNEWTWPDWTNRTPLNAVLELNSPQPAEKTFTPESVTKWKSPDPEVPESFAAIKRSGRIKMTAYQRGSKQVNDYVVSRPIEKYLFNHPSARGSENGQNRHWNGGPMWATIKYNEYFTYKDLENLPLYMYTEEDDSDLQAIVAQVKADTVSDLASQLDVSTTIAEYPEALRMIGSALKAARHPIKAIKDLQRRYARARRKGQSHLEALDDLSSAWLGIRYGVMPLVLTIQDAVELIDKKDDEYRTARSRESHDLYASRYASRQEGIDSGLDRFLYGERSGSIIVRGTGKARFLGSKARLYDQMKFNLLTTLWEVLPYSFVIDWFINVGDALTAHTSSLVNASQDKKYCLSFRTIETTNTYYYDDYYNKYSLNYQYWSNWWNLQSAYVEREFSATTDALLRSELTNSYDRITFNPSDTTLAFNVNLNALRSIDGAMLIIKQALKELRS